MADLIDLLQRYDVVGAFFMTIKLTLGGAVGALIIGTVIAVFRVSPVPVLRFVGTAYVTLIRNTPLTLIVFFCLFGLANTLQIQFADPDSPTSLTDSTFRLGLLGLSVYHASFVAEALR
ncbi:MAG TPA: ABC transporter permease subunit, partial [Microlunatus sp.]|nr:ABC transporter permease subunit [Microlunatus sp.]